LAESEIHVLVIEDNPGDVKLLEEMLRAGSESNSEIRFHLTVKEYLSQAVDHLNQEKTDIILLDLDLPDSLGMETYRILSQSILNIPIIVLSGNEEKDIGLETLRAGGQDYLIKGQIDSHLLIRSILYSIQRHRMRETLWKSGELLQRVLERNADGVLVVDPHNRVVFSNPTAEEMLDRKRNALIGQEIWFPVQYHTPTEVTFRRSGRSTIRVELLTEEIEWNEERAYLLSLRDITERDRIKVELQKEVEKRTQELVNLNQSLKEQIEERKVLEERLRQSQRLEAIGRLTGGIAHDYNNMIMAIHMCAKKALDPKVDDYQRADRLTEILHTSERAALITKQLLAFGRRQELRPETIDINQELKHSLYMLQHLLGEEVKLRPELSSLPLQVCVDPGQFQQVIWNLCINARDALDGLGEVLIKTDRVFKTKDEADPLLDPPAGNYVQVIVQDDGSGIKEEDLPKIFEPFFSTKAREDGTGLGLSTVHGIIKQSGGYIQVESQEGKGAVFEILLPSLSETAIPSVGDESDGIVESSAQRVLLVEDEPTLLRLLQAALEEAGFLVSTAENGINALEVAKSIPEISLVISDIIMPEMDGRNMIKELVSIIPGIKVLLMSGYAYEEDPLEGFDHSAYDFIQKPFTETALIERVKEIYTREDLTPSDPGNGS